MQRCYNGSSESVRGLTGRIQRYPTHNYIHIEDYAGQCLHEVDYGYRRRNGHGNELSGDPGVLGCRRPLGDSSVHKVALTPSYIKGQVSLREYYESMKKIAWYETATGTIPLFDMSQNNFPSTSFPYNRTHHTVTRDVSINMSKTELIRTVTVDVVTCCAPTEITLYQPMGGG